MEKNITLLNPFLEEIILKNEKIIVTHQVNQRQVSQTEGYIKDVFEKNLQWAIVMETGLAIPLQEIKSIVISSRSYQST
jgi:hypothetical protein